MASFTRKLKKILTDAGCTFHSQGKGDHENWWSPISKRKFTVDSNIKSKETANKSLRDAGLPKAF
jgi:hypothetical protein